MVSVTPVGHWGDLYSQLDRPIFLSIIDVTGITRRSPYSQCTVGFIAKEFWAERNSTKMVHKLYFQ